MYQALFANAALPLESKLCKVDSRYGPLIVPGGADDVIGRFLVRYGEWAWLEAMFAAGLLGSKARVLDGGAFIGTFGLGVKLYRPDTFVCFVEANPAVQEALHANVGDRGTNRSAIIDATIVGTGIEPRVGRPEPGNLGSMRYDVAGLPTHESRAGHRAMTLQSLRKTYGAFDLIKLDLEGMELEALNGDAEFLSTGQTMLWLECNEDARSLQLARYVLDWGLDLYYFAFSSFNPRNYNADPEPIYPMAYEAGLLVAPKQKPVLTDELRAARCILKPIQSLHELKLAMWRTPRWGMAGWDDAEQPELAALAGRLLRSEAFDSFLHSVRTVPEVAGWPASEKDGTNRTIDDLRALLAEERSKREQVEAGQREATALAITRLDELTVQRTHEEALHQGLQTAERLALERMEGWTEEVRRREAAERLALERMEGWTEEIRRREAVEHLASEHEAKLIDEFKRRAAIEAELARTSKRALAHLAALGRERDRVSLIAAAAERIPQLQAEVECLQATEARLQGVHAGLTSALLEAAAARRQAEERAAVAEKFVQIMQESSIWRLTASVRSFVGKRPYLRSVTRRGLRFAGLSRRAPPA